ncbi:excisionase [Ruegeria atlantica]|uniref:Helix-turn-helix domain protein n=1 Tax=Ruegeria atlantica TaxID=81569 RepID=A0A0P1EN87_9RHOB|nr:excisionase [Ruegeria atlantica]CUH41562.1 hypothetical protein RUM4293_00436 [Ruegeria atlantica]
MQLLTPEQKAKELQTTIRTLAEWRKLGIGPVYKQYGRHVRYYPETMPYQKDITGAA